MRRGNASKIRSARAVVDDGRADDYPVGAGIGERLHEGGLTYASAEFDGHTCCLDDFLDALQVLRLTLEGTVEIDDVEIFCAFADPAACPLGRVVAEGRLAVGEPLDEPDHLALPDVNCRDYYHIIRSFPLWRLPYPKVGTVLSIPRAPRRTLQGNQCHTTFVGARHASPAEGQLIASDIVRSPHSKEGAKPSGAGSCYSLTKFSSNFRPHFWLFSGWNWQAKMLSAQTADVKRPRCSVSPAIIDSSSGAT